MSFESRTFYPSLRAGLFAGAAVAALLAVPATLRAQDAPPATPTAQGTPATPAQAAQPAPEAQTLSNAPANKKKPKVAKDDRIQQGKDTKAAVKRDKKLDPLAGKDAQLPDKQLYDKAMAQTKSGHFDIARLDLQTLLNTYPDSQYMMRSKLAIADAWYKEGGSAALTQAEQEYKDFITFFPNVPEAAEAQLRVGDIYFKQMDIPDRDYSKGTHAEEEYRTMLKQYPDAPKPLTDEARQKLREVQEVLAEREAELGAFYGSHSNWAASIARYQTVVDTYPLYSHMDDVLIGVGDAYEAEATLVRGQKLPEGARVKLLEQYDGKAAEYYRRVVLEHSAAPHVEDAKERLATMNLPIPVPTPAQQAASEELEGSRAQYNLQKRLAIFFMHRPDTVTSAQTGIPTLDDPPPTVAPAITRSLVADYRAAFSPVAGAHAPTAAPSAADAPTTAAPSPDNTPVAPAEYAAPALSDVPAAGQGTGESSAGTMSSAPVTTGGSGGTSLGVEIVNPGANGTTVPAGTPASNRPSATGAPDPNFGLPAPPAKTAEVPAIEKPADAPDQVNDIAGKPQPASQVKDPNAKKKAKAPAVDKADESSSKKKPKKGVDKLNPF